MKLLMAFFITVLLYPASARAGDAAEQLEKMEGAWSVASAQEGGKEQTDEQSKKLSIVIKGDTLSFVSKGQPKTLDMKLKLDPSAKPATVDLISMSAKDRWHKAFTNCKGRD